MNQKAQNIMDLKMLSEEKLQRTDNYFYAQYFHYKNENKHNFEEIRFVIFAKKEKEAIELAKLYIEKICGKYIEFSPYIININNRSNLHLYRKNYIYDSRKLVAEGKCIA